MLEHCTFCGQGYTKENRTKDHPKEDTHCSKRCINLAAMTSEELKKERAKKLFDFDTPFEEIEALKEQISDWATHLDYDDITPLAIKEIAKEMKEAIK